MSPDDGIGELLSKTFLNETILTVTTYVIIIGASLVIANLLSRLSFVLKLATMGMYSVVDRGGGLLLGFLLGAALTSALVLGLAALAYGTDYDGDVMIGVGSAYTRVDGVVESLQGTLVGSRLVSVHMDAFDLLPGNALGYVPPSFTQAVDILQSEIEMAERVSQQ